MIMSEEKMDHQIPNIVIIDYGAGNVFSVRNALQSFGVDAIVSDDPDVIQGADKVIFPGVGAAGKAMNQLRGKGLNEIIPRLTQPVLGICLGMQLLMEFSGEDNTECLGVIPGEVKKISGWQGLRVPHMGWNRVKYSREHPLFSGMSEHEWMYFVHSYYVSQHPFAIGVTDYHESFTSVIEMNNFIGVQFHPEKSAESGIRLIQNFIKLY